MSRRSLWRRVARPARRILHRAATLIDPLVHPDPTGLLPPAHLRIYYYGSWAPELVTRAGENARIELMSRGLRPDHRVLDIGSGIGNLALALRDDLTGGVRWFLNSPGGGGLVPGDHFSSLPVFPFSPGERCQQRLQPERR